MKIVLLITVVESLALALWMMLLWHSRLRQSRVADAFSKLHNSPPRNDPAAATELSSFDAAHWAFINLRHLEGQADDRRPMAGTVPQSSGTPSAGRAFARRSHQMDYKQWSKERHD